MVATGATGTEGATVGGTVGAIVGAMVGAIVGGTVVGGDVVVPTFNPCWGSVVTVVPSAITKVVVSGSRSPVVVTPVMVAVHRPGALKFIPASSVVSAPPGRVIGTNNVYPGKFGFSGVNLMVKF